MKQISLLFILLFLYITSFSLSQTSVNQPFTHDGVYNTDSIKPQEYRQCCAAVIAMMDSGSIAIFQVNDPDNRNGDTDYKFRQNDNILYLTGCNETYSMLILELKGMQIDSVAIAKEILFVNKNTKSRSDHNLGVKGAKQVLGFGVEDGGIVLTTEKLNELLPQILKLEDILYYIPSLPTILYDLVSNIKFAIVRGMRKVLEEKYSSLSIKYSGTVSLNHIHYIQEGGGIWLT